jgi:hypothetical protein
MERFSKQLDLHQYSLMKIGNVIKINVANKLVYFGTNGMIVFQGVKKGITT